MLKKLITILAMLGMVSLGLVACGSETNASENWRPINLTLEGSVESVKCDQIDSAIRQVDRAVNEQDEELLQELGLLKDSKLNNAVVKTVRERLNATKLKCDGVAVEATAADCPDGTPLTYDPNKDFNVVSGGVKNRKEDLAAIKADPRNLAYRAHDLGFWENPNDWDTLVTNEGKCLSRKGESLLAKVEGALTASSTKVDENGKANANWYNTGMNAGGPVINPAAGIEGNLDAIVYTLADGTVIVVLKRCGNLALPSAPKHYTPVHIPGSRKPQPPGTGGPPPTTVTPPPPGKECPPGTTGTWPVCKDGVNQDPGNRGNATQGGGQNRNTSDPGTRAPYTPPPAAPYVPPTQPVYVPPEKPPTVTQQPAPTVTPTVAPSTQHPNHGTVVPTPGGDFG